MSVEVSDLNDRRKSSNASVQLLAQYAMMLKGRTLLRSVVSQGFVAEECHCGNRKRSIGSRNSNAGYALSIVQGQ